MARREELIALRISHAGLDAVDARAAARRVSRSEMIRVMLAYAAQRMPADWQPRGK